MSTSLGRELDPRLLIKWLGSEGAKVGMDRSPKLNLNALKEIAARLNIESSAKVTRKELIDEIVRVAGKRIEKSLDQLYALDQDDLVRYFEAIEVEPQELLDLLKDLNLKASRDSRGNLVTFVARELAETGRFMRIAGNRPQSAIKAAEAQ